MRERELKLGHRGGGATGEQSLPMRERELKPAVVRLRYKRIMSLPMRERELKRGEDAQEVAVAVVAPHAGA